jgi:hypothetical protein
VENYFSQILNVHRASGVRQREIRTAEPLESEHRPFEAKIAIAKLKRYKSQGTDRILAELIQAGSEIVHSEIHELLNSIWNTEKLPDQWKESILIPIHKKGDKTDCSNYRGISLLTPSYKMLLNILLSRLISYVGEIIGDHQCGFRRNTSTTDKIFFIRKILEKK